MTKKYIGTEPVDRITIKDQFISEVDLDKDDSIDAVIDQLIEIRDANQDVFSKMSLLLETDWDEIHQISVRGDRLENDQEYASRMERAKKSAERMKEIEAKQKIVKEERERKQYERLKKKFEGKPDEKETS